MGPGPSQYRDTGAATEHRPPSGAQSTDSRPRPLRLTLFVDSYHRGTEGHALMADLGLEVAVPIARERLGE